MGEAIAIIGLGAAGTALGAWLAARGQALVGGYGRRSIEGARRSWPPTVAVQQGLPRDRLDADLILLCVSDPAIAEVALAVSPYVPTDSVVAHVSGLHDSSALAPHFRHRASLHPLAALRDVNTAVRDLDTALFVVEGETTAVERLSEVVRRAGARVCEIESEAKARYHAAAVLGSNLVVGLLAVARDQLAAAGIAESDGALIALARSALDNAARSGLAGGLTGPIKRGDADAVARHLAALPLPDSTLYRLLSSRTLELIADELPDETVRSLRQLLLSP